MSWLGSLISGLFGLGTTAMNNKAQKKENEAQRAYEAEQAQINRDFEAEQAQINRDFQSKEAEEAYDRQVEFYEEYQSIGAQVNQYKEAGLNPALLAGGVSAGSTPQSSSPSGSMASGSQPHGTAATLHPFNFDFVTQALNLEQIKANIEKTRAEARNQAANALSVEIDNLTRGEMNEMTLRKGYSAIANSDADTAAKIEETKLFIAETIKAEASAAEIVERTALTAEQILTERVSRDLKTAQISEVGAHIKNMEVDTKVKAQQILFVIAQTDMTKQQASYFLSSAGVNDANVNKIWQECQNLKQDYDHNAIMNTFKEIQGRADSNLSAWFDVDNPEHSAVSNSIKRFYHMIEGLIDFSAGVGVSVKK